MWLQRPSPAGAGCDWSGRLPASRLATGGLVVRMQDRRASDGGPRGNSVARRSTQPKSGSARNLRDEGPPFDAHTCIDRGRSGGEAQDSAASLWRKLCQDSLRAMRNRDGSIGLTSLSPGGRSSGRTSGWSQFRHADASSRACKTGRHASAAPGPRARHRPGPRAGAGPTGARPGQAAGQRPPLSNILDREIVERSAALDPGPGCRGRSDDAAEAAGLANVLVPPVDLQNDTEAYGYPKGSRVYKINMQQAWALAIMNARFYQFNLEQVYLAALPVTLQRFSFEPQFYGGLGR